MVVVYYNDAVFDDDEIISRLFFRIVDPTQSEGTMTEASIKYLFGQYT